MIVITSLFTKLPWPRDSEGTSRSYGSFWIGAIPLRIGTFFARFSSKYAQEVESEKWLSKNAIS